jgi:hypothetical protein
VAYTPPTTSDLKARFPAFASVDASIIDTVLAEAVNAADDSWVNETDFRMGRMLYAAHVLTLDGFGTGAEADQARAGLLGFTTVKSGTLEVQRPAAGKGGMSSTVYGARYMELLKRNRGGAIVANSTD